MSHDNGDVAGVVATIERLAALPDRGRSLGEAGRAHLERRYARELAVDAYERVLADVAQVRLADAPNTLTPVRPAAPAR
ncbi:MAG: hypothetical protein H6745_17440 [Deltaproteobacteria bacterium]|nr:hypothetical protein [Deltaproteobacteria bacterium]